MSWKKDKNGMEVWVNDGATDPEVKQSKQKGQTFGQRITQNLGLLGKSALGFAKNVPKSAFRAAKDIGSAAVNVFNPNMEKNTVTNLGRLGLGSAQLASRVFTDKKGNYTKSEEQVRNVGKFYKNRYGGVQNIANTIHDDPIGWAMDMSILAGGAGSVAGKVGTVTKSAKLAKLGGELTRAGAVIDPLAQTSKLLSKAKVGPKMAQKGARLEEIGQQVSARQTKLTAADLKNFKKSTQQELSKVVNKYKLTGNTKQIIEKTDDLIVQKQALYDSKARNKNIEVNPSDYTSILRKEARGMRGGINPAQEMIADALEAKAKAIEDLAQKSGRKTVPVSEITDIKSDLYRGIKVENPQIAAAKRAEEKAGALAIEYIDNIVPGSASVGKELQSLRKFRELMGNREYAGLVGGLVKPSKIVEQLTGSPLAFSVAGKTMSGIGKGLQFAAKTPVGGIAKAGQIASRFSPATPTVEQPQEQTQEQSELAVPSAGATTSGRLYKPGESVDMGGGNVETGSPAQQNHYITGHSPQEIYREMMNAHNAGDNKTASFLRQMYNDELKYQKELNPAEKPLNATQIQSVNKARAGNRAMSTIKERIYKDDGTLDMNKIRATGVAKGALGIGDRTLYAALLDAAMSSIYIQSGAAFSEKELKARAEDYLSNFWGNEDSVRYQLKYLQGLFDDTMSQKGTSEELYFSNGQTAF